MKFEDSQLFYQVASVIGRSGAFLLFRAYLGRRIYIPAVIHPNHPLARVLGIELAQKLSEAFASDRLDIPTGRPKRKLSRKEYERRKRKIKKLRQQGHTIVEIANALRITRRTVSLILNGAREWWEYFEQLSLFD